MTQPLAYAGPDAAEALTRRRIALLAVYCLGCAVAAAVGGGFTFILIRGYRDGEEAWLVTTVALSALVGIALALLTRRVRRLHWVMVALGVPATIGLAAFVAYIYQSRDGSFMWLFVLQVYAALLAGAFCMLLAGIAGLALTRQAPG